MVGNANPWFKGTVSLCNKLISEKKSVKNYNIHENCDFIYLSRNKMIWIPEIGRQCYALIDAMFIETMWRHLVEWRHELTWSHRHACARGRHPISMRGKRLLMRILVSSIWKLLQLFLAQKLISSKCVLFQSNLIPSDTVPLKGRYRSTC